MNIRSLILVLLSIFYGLIGSIAQQKIKTERPNVIFILTDDQRFDAVGYAGNKFVETPEMDDLAKSCLLYTSDAADE